MTLVSETATLAYGYTMAEINKLARTAAHQRRNRLIDGDESFSIAWHAIVEALYTAEGEPARYELVDAAVSALSTEVSRQVSFRGLNHRATKDQPEGLLAPGFQKYWRSLEAAEDFTDRIVERLALPAVLALLTPKEYEAISTLAAFDGDTRAAADAVGMKLHTFSSNATRARHRIEAAWFEYETPRARKPRDPEKCTNGHTRADHGYVDKQGTQRCLLCRRRSVRGRGARRRAARFANSKALAELEADDLA